MIFSELKDNILNYFIFTSIWLTCRKSPEKKNKGRKTARTDEEEKGRRTGRRNTKHETGGGGTDTEN